MSLLDHAKVLFIVTLGCIGINAIFTTIADARARVVITAPTHRPNAEIICPWVTWSVAPDLPIEEQQLRLGVCPPRGTPRYY